MASMEDILKGTSDKPEEPKAEAKEEKPEQEAAAETSEQKPEEQTQEESAVSEGKEETKDVKAAPSAAEKSEHTVPLAVHLEERKRFQSELDELRKPKEEETPTDFFEDPEAALKQRDQAFNDQLLKQKLEMSQAMAEQNHADFNEVLGKFNTAMETDASLGARAKIIWNDALSKAHPAEEIYKAVKRELALQEISDPDELRKKIEAEVRAELAKEKPEEKPAPDIPESLADERSVGSRSGPEWAGPTPLGEIIKSA